MYVCMCMCQACACAVQVLCCRSRLRGVSRAPRTWVLPPQVESAQPADSWRERIGTAQQPAQVVPVRNLSAHMVNMPRAGVVRWRATGLLSSGLACHGLEEPYVFDPGRQRESDRRRALVLLCWAMLQPASSGQAKRSGWAWLSRWPSWVGPVGALASAGRSCRGRLSPRPTTRCATRKSPTARGGPRCQHSKLGHEREALGARCVRRVCGTWRRRRSRAQRQLE